MATVDPGTELLVARLQADPLVRAALGKLLSRVAEMGQRPSDQRHGWRHVAAAAEGLIAAMQASAFGVDPVLRDFLDQLVERILDAISDPPFNSDSLLERIAQILEALAQHHACVVSRPSEGPDDGPGSLLVARGPRTLHGPPTTAPAPLSASLVGRAA